MVDAVVDGDDVDVVSPRGLGVVEVAAFCGIVVAALEGCVVAGLSEESSSLHAVTPTNSATVATSAVATRVDFTVLPYERLTGSGRFGRPRRYPRRASPKLGREA